MDLTITRKESWNVYRIPANIFLRSIEALEELKLLKSLRIDLMHKRESSSMLAFQGHLMNLHKLQLISCSFIINEQEILDYINVAENLTILSLSNSKVVCENINEFYGKVLDIVMKRSTKLPLMIFGWKNMEKPEITSNWLKILQN